MTKEELYKKVILSTGNESNIRQIYAIKDGIKVYEENWHGYKREDAVHVMSVTKSVMALLTGIAIDQGYIKSVDQKPRKNEWYSDPKDTVTAGWGLCFSAEALAKLGMLVLCKGTVDDKQIVSEAWINDMITPKQKLGERFGYMEYGYLWYKPFEDKNVYAAIGDGGNVIYANFDKDIAVGVTAVFKPQVYDRVQFIEKNVLPIIES